jgi:hypothetical protein
VHTSWQCQAGGKHDPWHDCSICDVYVAVVPRRGTPRRVHVAVTPRRGPPRHYDKFACVCVITKGPLFVLLAFECFVVCVRFCVRRGVRHYVRNYMHLQVSFYVHLHVRFLARGSFFQESPPTGPLSEVPSWIMCDFMCTVMCT